MPVFGYDYHKSSSSINTSDFVVLILDSILTFEFLVSCFLFKFVHFFFLFLIGISWSEWSNINSNVRNNIQQQAYVISSDACLMVVIILENILSLQSLVHIFIFIVLILLLASLLCIAFKAREKSSGRSSKCFL